MLGDFAITPGSASFIGRNIATDPLIVGNFSLLKSVDGREVFFNYVSPNGDDGLPTIVRSPLVRVDKVNYATVKLAAYRNPQQVTVTIPATINGGNPIVGQDYILRFVFYGLGIGGQELQYVKEGGAYRVRQGDTAAVVLQTLVSLANVNFLREPTKMVDIAYSTNSIVVTGVEQPWVLGKKQGDPLQFKVECVPVYDSASNVEIPWGLVTDTTATGISTATVFNGNTIADMEWFYVGGRADHQRQWVYPDDFQTKYVANASFGYDTVDLDFYFSGDSEDVQRSRIALSLACKNDKINKTAGTIALGNIATQLTTDLQTLGITVS